MKLNCCKVAKKLETGRIMIVHLKYPLLSQVHGWKQILREPAGDVWEENGTKSRRESKLLEIFCFLSSKYWAERGEGGVMVITAGTWYLTCDTQHYRPLPPPGSGHCQCDESDERPSGNLSSKLKKKIQNLIGVRHDILFFMMKCVTWWVFILHYIKVCCWYCDI